LAKGHTFNFLEIDFITEADTALDGKTMARVLSAVTFLKNDVFKT
jgi:hypothetical protein